ncbi:hypothetical protein BU16DRAFT_228157 [Lophium mytilinum]|uniref:Carbohydrate esterase family 16 protein n=1 Tax=Lophium mytilinum TaxID=390894 RepID=A0A6A6Q877_9PEZI|nr:hypothetical protein BU16DRAFT_228157 [Lophium mytilinum]
MKISILAAVILTLSAFTEAHPKPNKLWPGWKGIKYFFVFGDSYTTTGFNISLAQPNPANPLGNPDFPGFTSSNGPNWVDFLTLTYNCSYIQTYNLAFGGATVDSALVTPYKPTVLSLKQQVQDEYLPAYGSHPKTVPWASFDSLFSIFIGINDVGNSYSAQNASLYPIIFKEYEGLVKQLYTTGARNFLFLTVPPVHRSPLTLATDPASQLLEKHAIADFNARITHLASSLRSTHADATVFVYDTYSLFNKVLDNPKSLPQTKGYKNTTAYCDAYANGTPEWDSFNATCGIPVNEYFWLNSLHPTYPMHDAIAAAIVKLIDPKSWW